MKILFVASEAAPYVKTGGLGDVIGALPRALAARGHELLVVVPRYNFIDAQAHGLRDTGRRIEVQFPGMTAGAHVYVHVPAERLRYLFLQNPWYDRKELYGEAGKGYLDNPEGLAQHRGQDLTGIMNGVDYSQWSPEGGPALDQRYSASDLSGKSVDKAALQRELGLAVDSEALLCAAIGRLAHQKGYDILAKAVPELVQRKAQLALLGTGDTALEAEFAALAERFPGRGSLQLRLDDRLAHPTQAGADVFVMPSRFEPCGLNQLYSLRYGTLPLVHAVGGLIDSIQEGPEGWGFLFDQDTPEALVAALDRAVALFKDPPRWQAAMLRAMARDHSWDRAAGQYETLYKG